ncbi:LOW QUALITY PROTEIN: hypothetical protein HID58_017206 [Brassica napus]|uniref:Cytochrome P450 n=1 Tax=Brassica napus TaxID=3708 RepID=A0ABQ8D6F0_BRANA|nr:LOW QUALITY PROTEIN: hypothetical protein HID58_017206 [Brassica napus]
MERSGGGAVEDETSAVEVDEDGEFGLRRGDVAGLEETDEGMSLECSVGGSLGKSRLWNNRSSGNFKNQDQQQIHVGRLSTKGGNDATRLRFIDPLWKLKWFLNIGSQARLKKSIATIDKFVYRLIITKRKEQNTAIREDILSRFLVEREKDPERMNDKYLRDIILSFDRWEGHNRCISLLVLVHALQKPTCSGENKIRDVTSSHEETTDGKGFVESIDEEALDQMQYLHAALSETLRLYTAVPVDTRCTENDDVLPNGHRVKRRAEEFKPERWLKDGVFQPESPFKFISFYAGPGICPGKDFAYRQMKIVSMALLHFRIVDEKNLISNSKVGEKSTSSLRRFYTKVATGLGDESPYAQRGLILNEQGLYRVDNESMRDNNSWLHSSLLSNKIRFHIRLSIGYAIDFGDFVFALYRRGDLHIPMY